MSGIRWGGIVGCCAWILYWASVFLFPIVGDGRLDIRRTGTDIFGTLLYNKFLDNRCFYTAFKKDCFYVSYTYLEGVSWKLEAFGVGTPY